MGIKYCTIDNTQRSNRITKSCMGMGREINCIVWTVWWKHSNFRVMKKVTVLGEGSVVLTPCAWQNRWRLLGNRELWPQQPPHTTTAQGTLTLFACTSNKPAAYNFTSHTSLPVAAPLLTARELTSLNYCGIVCSHSTVGSSINHHEMT